MPEKPEIAGPRSNRSLRSHPVFHRGPPIPIAAVGDVIRESESDHQASLDSFQVLSVGLTALLIGHHIERQPLSLVEGRHARLLDSADMNKNIRSSAFGSDEAESLLGVEKLNRAGGHVSLHLQQAVDYPACGCNTMADGLARSCRPVPPITAS